MGFPETFVALQNTWKWITVDTSGFPSYRLNNDGSIINSVQREQNANQISQQFNLVSGNQYIAQDKAPLAYA